MKEILHLIGGYYVEDNTTLGIKSIPLITSLELTEELLSFGLWSESFWRELDNWIKINIDNRCIQINGWITYCWLEFKELCG